MAAQDAFTIDAFMAELVALVKDMLVDDRFGPKALLSEAHDLATRYKATSGDIARSASMARSARLKVNGGCPTCADDPSAATNPAHAAFHLRMTGRPLAKVKAEAGRTEP
jgi:hypothetical protein